MRGIATKKKPMFVQANFNSGQGHVLHYITSFCVVIRLSTLYFWLAGKTETKQVVNRMSKWVEGGGSWKGHESGQAVFIFLARSHALRAQICRLHRSCARLGKTAMLRRLRKNQKENNRHCVTCYVISMVYTLIDHSSQPISMQGFAQLLQKNTYTD